MASKLENNTRYVTVSPTISTSIYAAGDVVGGLQRLRRALGPYRSGVLRSIIVRDDDNEKPVLTFLFFQSEPASVAADNGALTLTTADLALLVGKANVAGADYETVGGQAVAHVDVSKVLEGYDGGTAQLKDFESGDLWVVPVITSGTPTFTATTDLSFSFGFQAD